MMVSGVPQLQELLRAMPAQMRSMIMEPIVSTLVQTGVRLARTTLPRMLPKRDPATRRWDRPTGALRDSLGSKVMPRSRMRNKDIVFGLYGARLDFRVTLVTARRVAAIRRVASGPLAVGRVTNPNGRTNTRSGSIQPAKYIHLVEGGHRGSRFFPAARAYPFMAHAKSALAAIMPTLVRERWAQLYPMAIDRLRRRYTNRIQRAVARTL